MVRTGGAVPENEISEAKVPLLISANYLEVNKQALLSGQLKTAPGKGGGATVKDFSAPTVSITSPASGATVSGTVNITVTATDNVGVSSVSVSIDGTSSGSKSTEPYSFSCNTTGIAAGTHN